MKDINIPLEKLIASKAIIGQCKKEKRVFTPFEQAQKYNCTKLSCPEKFLYDLYYKRNGYSDIIFQLQTLRQLKKKLGKYYETHPNLRNEGYQEFLLRCARKCHGTKKK